ncbi:ligand-binding sensor domain-containing protein [Pedobacter sp. W3I1]|uniref:ligand-binding sensor domain-containing protein n=1 Tax=Pedobacter sp. W3I1 TaxID=3042291 RepID=UPI002789AC1C|nr:two-component regulator propeller domain-containing protein [Pedobacter sp. W3I1]MDQ0641216.1 ligand-binding sensor domain-containing protein [Pedobacter sp. W3I1]
MRVMLFLIAFFYAASLFAQTGVVKYLSLQEGLSSQQAIDVAHDKHGFIWVATELGLNRFASNSFKQYYKTKKAVGLSVNSNEINTLLCDNDQLFIGTRASGLNVLDMKTNRFSYYLHDPKNSRSIATNDITDIIKSKSGKLWLSTYHQGVQLFDPLTKEFECFNRKNIPSLPENSIWTVAEDKQGFLYLGHVHKGVSILNTRNRKVELLNTENTHGMLPENEVKALFCDSKNNIWIGTRKGLAVYNPSTKSIRSINLAGQSKNADEPFVHSIKEINGAIWIGAESSQLFILEPDYHPNGEIHQIRKITPVYLNSGSNSSVQNIDRDEFGNVWLAIYGGGAAFFSHIKPFFSVFPTQDIMHGSAKLATVTGIVYDKKRTVWLATAGDGILQIQANGKVIKTTMRNSGIGDDFLLSCFEDSQNNKWFGLQKGGVSVLNAKTNNWQRINAGEKMSAVRAIIEDTNGNICFAAEEGLFIHNPKLGTFRKIITNTPMLGDYAPRTIVEDSKGYMWVGTYGQGLYIFDRNWKIVQKILKGHGINSNTINHLFRDRGNNIWIATNEGLAFQSINREVGRLENIILPDSDAWLTIDAVAEDNNRNIWCSTRLGILRYLPKEKRLLRYDESFGLPLGGFANNSTAVDKRGRLFFGMPGGSLLFRPG